MLAPLAVRRDALELAKLVYQGDAPQSASQFKLVEIELDRQGKVTSRNVSGVPFRTKAEAEGAAQRSAESIWANGYNEEHGYRWARDLRDRSYRFFVEPY